MSCVGLDASEIAHALSLNRTCVSRDLNALYRDGMALKILGKPTQYLHYDIVAEYLDNRWLPNTIPLGSNLSDYSTGQESGRSTTQKDIAAPTLFDPNSVSLRYAFLQAEAAIRYPGSSLHTLIFGQHGIGKHTFLEKMFLYGKATGNFSPDVKLHTLNCHSSVNSLSGSVQSLTIQLFGCASGLFSSNSPSRKGLVEQAAGSILLLEEVQFLPAVVQEKLIGLLTHNTFSRLGEESVSRQAHLMVVGTCSEIPPPLQRCPLLQYFSSQITLPPLSERTPRELFLYISQAFETEAKALNCELHISRDVFHYLMCAAFSRAFVSLQGYIKSICALAYSDQESANPRYFIEVRYRHLPQSILSSRLVPSAVAQNTSFLAQHFERNIVIRPDGASPHLSALSATFFPMSQENPEYAPDLRAAEYYLEKYLYAAFEADGKRTDENAELSAAACQILHDDPVLGQLGPNDPLIQGLAALFSKKGADHSSFRPLRGMDTISFSQAAALPAMKTVFALEQQLKPLLELELSEHQRAFIASYLQLIQQRAVSEQVLMFIAFHGTGVSTGMSDYIANLYHCRIHPLSFAESDTLESIFAEINSVIAAASTASCVLFFSDGLPLDSLHDYVEAVCELPAKTIRGATFEIIQQIVKKVVQFHFTADMIGSYAPLLTAGSSAEASTQLSPLVHEAIQRFLIPSLTFIDINSISPLLEDSLRTIGTQLQIPISDDIAIKYHFHCAHMVERLIRKAPFDYPHLKVFVNQHSQLIRVIQTALQPISRRYGIRIPSCEIAYLAEIFLAM